MGHETESDFTDRGGMPDLGLVIRVCRSFQDHFRLPLVNLVEKWRYMYLKIVMVIGIHWRL
jgi:hypothetical protein